MPFGHHFDIQPAGITRGTAYGVRQIQLLMRPLACELAKPAQCHLDVADPNRYAVVEIAKPPLLPHLDRAFVARLFLTDAKPFRIVAVCTKRRSAARADPFV